MREKFRWNLKTRLFTLVCILFQGQTFTDKLTTDLKAHGKSVVFKCTSSNRSKEKRRNLPQQSSVLFNKESRERNKRIGKGNTEMKEGKIATGCVFLGRARRSRPLESCTCCGRGSSPPLSGVSPWGSLARHYIVTRWCHMITWQTVGGARLLHWRSVLVLHSEEEDRCYRSARFHAGGAWIAENSLG